MDEPQVTASTHEARCTHGTRGVAAEPLRHAPARRARRAPRLRRAGLVLAATALSLAACSEPDRPQPVNHTDNDDVSVSLDGGTAALDAVDTGRSTGAGCVSDQDCETILTDIPPCSVPRCVSSACVLGKTPDGEACDDGSPCTQQTVCVGGSCIKGTPVPCDDDNPCTTDSCGLPGGCTHTANHAPCSASGCDIGVCGQGACAVLPRYGASTLPGRSVRGMVATAEGWALAAQETVTHTDAPAPQAAHWLRVNPVGEPFVDLPLALTQVEAVTVTTDSDLVFAGADVRADGSTDGAMVRMRLDGSQRWRRSYARSAEDRLAGVVALPDSTVAACGTVKTGAHADAWYVRGSVPTGYPLLDFTYGSTQDERCHGLVRLGGGDLLMVGDQTGSGASKAMAFRVSLQAKLVWNKSWGGAGPTAAYGAAPLPDGGAWIAGACAAQPGDAPDGCLWRLSSSGDVLIAHTVLQPGLGTAGSWAAMELRAVARQGGLGLVAVGRARPTVGAPWRPVALWRDALANPVAAAFVGGAAGGLRAVVVAPDTSVALAGEATASVVGAGTSVGTSVGLVVRATASGLPCDGAATCASAGLQACDDGDPCTADWCAAACGHNPLPEGATCGLGLTCQSGTCAAPP